MNEAKQDFFRDVAQKKNVARSARNKTGAPRSCTLSQDTMTQKELNAKNGNVLRFELGKPMTWKTFRLMPRDLQNEYLTKLRQNFNASPQAIAKMLNVSIDTFRLYIKDTILSDPIKHRRFSAEQEAAWQRFNCPTPAVNPVISTQPDVIDEPKPEEPKPEEPTPTPEEPTQDTGIDKLELRMTGTTADLLRKIEAAASLLGNESYSFYVAVRRDAT